MFQKIHKRFHKNSENGNEILQTPENPQFEKNGKNPQKKCPNLQNPKKPPKTPPPPKKPPKKTFLKPPQTSAKPHADINECTQTPCNTATSSCQNLIGGFECHCLPGYLSIGGFCEPSGGGGGGSGGSGGGYALTGSALSTSGGSGGSGNGGGSGVGLSGLVRDVECGDQVTCQFGCVTSSVTSRPRCKCPSGFKSYSWNQCIGEFGVLGFWGFWGFWGFLGFGDFGGLRGFEVLGVLGV